MATAATPATWATATPSLLSKNAFFFAPPLSAVATTAARFTRRRRSGGDRAVLAAPPRSGRQDEWDADSGGGRLVDEDMATLRRRIREARALCSDSDSDSEDGDGLGLGLPAEWTELERRHHGSYVAGVAGAAGLLRALLTSARPGLGAGVVALLLLSVPASVLLLAAQLIQAVDSLSSTMLNGR